MYWLISENEKLFLPYATLWVYFFQHLYEQMAICEKVDIWSG